MVVAWTAYAEHKLDKIYDYYVERSPQAANRMFACIMQTANSLAESPQRVPVIFAYRDKIFRERLVLRPRKKIHKIIYYIQDETVYIASVWDCRQNPQRLITELKSL
jgi:plasmid stabilization system protein ParE